MRFVLNNCAIINRKMETINDNPMSFADNQHGNIILERLRKQRESGRFCDVLLIVKDRHYAAHRTVLAAASPYFDSILRHSKVVKEHVTVACSNTDSFELLLSYIYSGAITLDRNNVIDVLKLANNFLVTKLKIHCSEYLDRYLDANNCLQVKDLATRYNMPLLKQAADNYLLMNPNECVSAATALDKYPLFRVENIIADHTLRLSGETQLKFLLKWTQANMLTRVQHFNSLLKHVRIESIIAEDLTEWIDTNSVFTQHGDIRLAMYEKMIAIGHAIADKHRPDYQALLDGKPNGTRTEVPMPETGQIVNGDRRVQEGEKLDYTPLAPYHIEEATTALDASEMSTTQNSEEENIVDGDADRAPLKLSIKLNIKRQQGPNINPITGKRNYVRRSNASDESGLALMKKANRGRPSKERLAHEEQLAAEHEVAEMTLATSLEDEDDEFAGIRDDGDMQSDEFSEIDDAGLSIDELRQMRGGDEVTVCDSSNKMLFKCNDCIYMSNDEQGMQNHIARAHKECPRFFVCALCNKFETRWNDEYLEHMKIQHFKTIPYQCDYCDYRSDKLQALLSHRMGHNNDKPYRCALVPDCTYRCRLKSSLIVHQRQHTGERPFQCTQCGKSFAIKNRLDHHMTTHSDNRPHACDKCPFSTKYASHLTSHMRIHTGDVYHCTYSECPYSSPKKSQLAAHLRTHLAVRAFSCKICNRSFIEKSHLVRHERIHLIEKPFKCDDCNYASSRRDKLKEHVLKHHGSQSTLRQKQRKYRRAKQLAVMQAKDGAVPHISHIFRPISVEPGQAAPQSPFRLIDDANLAINQQPIPTATFAHQNRPTSEILQSFVHDAMQPSPAQSLNFDLGYQTPAVGAKNDVILSSAQNATPTLVTPHPRSPAASLQDNYTPLTQDQSNRPMSLPHFTQEQPPQ